MPNMKMGNIPPEALRQGRSNTTPRPEDRTPHRILVKKTDEKGKPIKDANGDHVHELHPDVEVTEGPKRGEQDEYQPATYSARHPGTYRTDR